MRWRRATIRVFACWLGWAGGLWIALAAVPPSALERLQQLARLPQIEFRTGVEFHPVRGYGLMMTGGVSRREVEALDRRLKDSPGDPAPYVALADLLTEAGNRRAGEALLARAAELCRQLGAEDTADAERLVTCAEVLWRLGRWAEAERALRRAVQAAPQQWRPAAGLARVLSARALSLVCPGVTDLHTRWGTETPGRADFTGPADPAAAETARQWMREARTLAELAVSLDPAQADAYRTRATVQANHRLLEVRLMPRESEDDPAPWLSAIFHPDARADLRRVAELEPDNPEAHGTLALWEVLTSAGHPLAAALDDLLNRRLWPGLPEQARASVRAALAQLDRLGQDAEPPRASVALATAGLLQFFLMDDTTGGLASLRRAVTLDPDNDRAWETLTFALAFAREHAELLTVCRRRLELRDGPRLRLLLAKALEKTRQFEAMLDAAEESARRFSEDALAHLTAAAALLKMDPSAQGRARAQQHLARAVRLAGDRPAPGLTVELLFQRGLWFALEGQVEQARTQFRGILELVPDHPDATAALSALEQFGEAASD